MSQFSYSRPKVHVHETFFFVFKSVKVDLLERYVYVSLQKSLKEIDIPNYTNRYLLLIFQINVFIQNRVR